MTLVQPPHPGLPLPLAVADISLHPVTFDEAVDWVCARARTASGGIVCTPNADYVVRAHRDEQFRDAIQGADLRVPDGMAVIYAARLAGVPLRGTVTGRLLVPAIAACAQREDWPIALYGAATGTAQAAGQVLAHRFPGLSISDALSPPMGMTIGSAEDNRAVDLLAASGARVIFVALGAPKQEAWMIAHRDRLAGAVLVGVGAAFDILAGRFREAPPWMTRIGVEWVFRLAQEPKRLARRYLVDDPWIFFWAVAARLEMLKRRRARR